jgi:bifunctional non-homologous end joining protein LigD
MPSQQPKSRVHFTHTDKVMFPAARPPLTKADVLAFYQTIAPRLLPHLKDRPITVERLPEGLSGADAPRFWQKNTPSYYPKWIKRVEIPTGAGKPVQYSLVNDLDTLLYFVNQGTITFHTYFSRVDDLKRPDFVLFDLDPHNAKFTDAVKIAKQLHETLDEHDTPAFVKTSGKSGLHVLVDWNRRGDYAEARDWALDIANTVCAQLPKIATTERAINKRGGRVYVDVMQNALGHHAVPPYVLRATSLATVSMPLRWDELTTTLNPAKFTTKVALARIKRSRIDPIIELTR